MATPIHEPQQGPAAQTTPEDFILRLHNEGMPQHEIADRYAKRYFGHGDPSEGDLRFVDHVLTNREG